MRFHRHRSNYWSCSNLANWMLLKVGVTKPDAETSEGWKAWRNMTQAAHPVIYNFIEEQLDTIQDIIMFPYDVYDSIRVYLRNRFVTRTHLIDTKLIPGEWHEADDRLLHGSFELLVEFIEIEKAHMNRWSKASTTPWYKKLRCLRWGEERSAKDGLEYLEWEMSLTDYEEGIHFSRQALAAQVQYELYNWWKNIRPNRPDPYEITGWNALNDTLPDVLSWERSQDSDEYKQLNVLSKKVNDMEEAWEKEDEEMLKKLIDIRRSLWT